MSPEFFVTLTTPQYYATHLLQIIAVRFCTHYIYISSEYTVAYLATSKNAGSKIYLKDQRYSCTDK